MVDPRMDALTWLRKQLQSECPDLARAMLERAVRELMGGAEADALCGAAYGERSLERVNQRNGYRPRRWDTRAGTIELEIPKLRQGSSFPDWLITPRRRAEKALMAAIADAYLAGVSTRRVDKLVAQLGIEGISKSQVSQIAAALDEIVEAFRARPLVGPYPYVWLDALVVHCRDDAQRMSGVCCLVAVGVNPEGRREVLGLELVGAEDGAGWLGFLRGLLARGLSGVQLVISDAHPGLVEAARSVMAGAVWQRCRTHYLRNLLTRVPKSAQPLVATLVRSIFAQPDAAQVAAQHERVVDQLAERFPAAAGTWQRPAPRSWPSPRSPRSTGARSGRPTLRSGSTRRSAGVPMSSGPSRTGKRPAPGGRGARRDPRVGRHSALHDRRRPASPGPCPRDRGAAAREGRVALRRG
jgi:transposase-like protein